MKLAKQHLLALFIGLGLVSCQNQQEKTNLAQNNPKVARDVIAKMVDAISSDSIEATVKHLVAFGTRHSLSDTVSDSRGIGAARRWVVGELARHAKTANGRMDAFLDPFVVEKSRRIPNTVTMKNAMAVLKGTDPSDHRVLVISGHLDSRGSDVMNDTIDAPGADDDASGVALVMELARVMAPYQFPATIVFVAVSGEEQGLFGARHLAEKYRRDSVEVIAMFNNDMVGNTTASGTGLSDSAKVRVFSETIPALETDGQARVRKYTGAENDSPSRQLARYIKRVSENYVPGFEITLNYRIDRFLRGGDHTPFSQNGFTAIRFCEMHENYYHQHQDVRVEDGIQYGDLPAFVDYQYATKVAKANLASLASLALAPYAPEKPGLLVNLNNETTITWSSPKQGQKPKGYQVLYRETYEATWTGKLTTQDTFAVLPYSKDNYFFAVQSVSAPGYTSLPVFPEPRRP